MDKYKHNGVLFARREWLFKIYPEKPANIRGK
jgi:hypothetical protein